MWRKNTKKEKPFIYFYCIELQQFNIIHICTEFQIIHLIYLHYIFNAFLHNNLSDFVVNMAIV